MLLVEKIAAAAGLTAVVWLWIVGALASALLASVVVLLAAAFVLSCLVLLASTRKWQPAAGHQAAAPSAQPPPAPLRRVRDQTALACALLFSVPFYAICCLAMLRADRRRRQAAEAGSGPHPARGATARENHRAVTN